MQLCGEQPAAVNVQQDAARKAASYKPRHG